MDPRQYAESLEERFVQRYAQRFYSRIELKPGEITTGTFSPNIGLTRTLMGRTEVAGKTCVDVASVDGWACILMHRRGAANVVGIDRNDFTPLISRVRQELDVQMTYLPLVKSDQWRTATLEAGFRGFDVVVNSGLLYHVLGPINTLAHSRSLVKTGGIMILETACHVRGKGCDMQFNEAGKMNMNDPTFFFSCSPAMLDTMLRLLRLVPIDFCYIGGRMAIAARATADVVPLPGDEWLARTYMARDILDLIDWSILDETSNVSYDLPESRKDAAYGVDIRTAIETEPQLTEAKDLVTLHLRDTI